MEGSRALFGRGLGRDLEPLGASWVVLGFPFFTLVFGVVVKSALGGTSAGLWLDFQGFGEDFGRVWGGFWEGLGGIFEHSGRFWAILGYSGLFWVIGLFLAALRKIFAGAVCCLLLLSWSLSSKSVLAFACCCLPGHVFASRSTELILNLNSCWLCCLLLLSFACFGLLWLALACFGCFGCAFRSIAAQVHVRTKVG